MFGWNWQRFFDQWKWSPDRSQIGYLLPFDGRQYLDSISRKETVRLVEGLAQRFGIVKEGFRGIARHTIGKGLELQLNTNELDWNEDAQMQFEEYAITPGRFDIAGRRTLYEAQHTAVEQRLFRGEFFSAAVLNPRWEDPVTKLQEPAWQLYDTNEISDPSDEFDGPRDRIFDGVRVDKYNFPQGYFTVTAEGNSYIPAANMVHWFQPTGINQVRGESDFAPVINRLVDWDDLTRLFTKQAKTHATLALTVSKLAKAGGRGALGAISKAGPINPGEAGTNIAPLEKAFPGMIAYLGQDGEVKMLNSNSPSESLAKFVTDVLCPEVFAALGIPPEFFWQCTRAGGASQRFVLTRADLLFQVLADSLTYKWLNAVAFRFISHRIKIGRLRQPKDPNWSARMSWQTPAKLSIDRGDAALEITQLANGTINLRNIFDRRSQRWTEETRQWIREWIVFGKIADEEGATPEMKAMLMSRWRAPAPGTAAASPEEKEEEPTPAPAPAPPAPAPGKAKPGDKKA